MRRLMYIGDDGRGAEITNEAEMIDAIKGDRSQIKLGVSTTQELAIQQTIADMITFAGGKPMTDNGDAMIGAVVNILAILGLERER